MRELNLEELESVNGGETNWNAVGTTLALVGIAISAPVSMPVLAGTAAFGAMSMGMYSMFSSMNFSG